MAGQPTYDVIPVNVSEAPADSRKGSRYAISARSVTVAQVPADANVRVSFDLADKFVPVHGGETFKACGAEGFQAVYVLWDQLAVEDTADAEFAYLFAGGESMSLEVCSPREDVPDTDGAAPVMYSYTLAADFERQQALDGDDNPLVPGAEDGFVRVRAPSSNTNPVRVYLADADGPYEELAPGESLDYFLGATDAELWFAAETADDIVTVYDAGS